MIYVNYSDFTVSFSTSIGRWNYNTSIGSKYQLFFLYIRKRWWSCIVSALILILWTSRSLCINSPCIWDYFSRYYRTEEWQWDLWNSKYDLCYSRNCFSWLLSMSTSYIYSGIRYWQSCILYFCYYGYCYSYWN